MTLKQTWRNDPGLIFETEYKKKFAWLPVRCNNEEKKIWWKTYYQSFMNWGHSYSTAKSQDGMFMSKYHQDFLGNITEEEYLVRKLSDTL